MIPYKVYNQQVFRYQELDFRNAKELKIINFKINVLLNAKLSLYNVERNAFSENENNIILH